MSVITDEESLCVHKHPLTSFYWHSARQISDHNKMVQKLYEEMEQQIEGEKQKLQNEVGAQLDHASSQDLSFVEKNLPFLSNLGQIYLQHRNVGLLPYIIIGGKGVFIFLFYKSRIESGHPVRTWMKYEAFSMAVISPSPFWNF